MEGDSQAANRVNPEVCVEFGREAVFQEEREGVFSRGMMLKMGWRRESLKRPKSPREQTPPPLD